MSGSAHVNLIGYSPGASTTAGTLWTVGSGTSYVQLTTGSVLEAVSSSASDAAASTGARTILITGVDGNYAPFQETITLNGTTVVPLVNTSVIAINDLKILTAGSGGTNAGSITIRLVAGSVTKRRISSDIEAVGKSQDFLYTMPASRYGLLKRIQVYFRTNTGDAWVYLNSYNSSGVKSVEAGASVSLDNTGFAGGPIMMDFGTGLYIPEKTLIELRVDVSAGTPIVTAIGELEIYTS